MSKRNKDYVVSTKDIDLFIVNGVLTKEGVGITFNISIIENNDGAELTVRTVIKIPTDHPTKFAQSNSETLYQYVDEPIKSTMQVDKDRVTNLILQQMQRHYELVYARTNVKFNLPTYREVYDSLTYLD